jgi:Carbamoyltransferase C-terminus
MWTIPRALRPSTPIPTHGITPSFPASKHSPAAPFLLITSFNVRDEPIVCTPQDAFRCFMGTEMDVLVIGDCVLWKEEQNPALKRQFLEPSNLTNGHPADD